MHGALLAGTYPGLWCCCAALCDKGLCHDEADRPPQACYGRKDYLPSGQIPAVYHAAIKQMDQADLVLTICHEAAVTMCAWHCKQGVYPAQASASCPGEAGYETAAGIMHMR